MHCSSLLGSIDTSLEEELQSEVYHFRSHTFANSTKHLYRTYRDSFLRFCFFMGFNPVPADSNTICLYAAFLTRSLKFSSVNNYLGVIALLHKEFGLPNPLTDNWVLKSLLTGIKRVKGNLVQQNSLSHLISYCAFIVLLILIRVLILLFGLLALLLSFFFLENPICYPYLTSIMILTSSLLDLVSNFFIGVYLCQCLGARLSNLGRDQYIFHFLVHLVYHFVQLLAFCMLSFTGSSAPSSHAFAYFDPSHRAIRCLTYRSFVTKLRDCLSRLGIPTPFVC